MGKNPNSNSLEFSLDSSEQYYTDIDVMYTCTNPLHEQSLYIIFRMMISINHYIFFYYNICLTRKFVVT